jgi:hypothetical protein
MMFRMFTARIVGNTQIQNTELLVVEGGGVNHYHLALRGYGKDIVLWYLKTGY